MHCSSYTFNTRAEHVLNHSIVNFLPCNAIVALKAEQLTLQ